MAAEVQPLPQWKLPSGPEPVTAEQRYWKSFKNPKFHTSTASWAVTSITFPASPVSAGGAVASSSSLTTATARSNDLFAVTAGLRVDIYSVRRREPIKTIGRFDSVARSGDVRADSRVLLAGEDSGRIQVFDVASGGRAAVLKTWHLHKQPVWVTRWSPYDLTTLMSASDDKTVRLWDLPGQEATRIFFGHQDYVRCGGFMVGHGASNNLLVSGSYDSTVQLWDARAPGGSVLTFKHAAPVEAVLPLPSGTSLVAAADNAISVLDLVAAKPLRLVTNHQKTVTSLSLASQGTRVVSGGLDGHVKVFDIGNWNVVAGFKYPSPVLAVSVVTAGAAHDDRHLAVGMESGVLSLRTRLTGAVAQREREKAVERAAHDAGTAEIEQLERVRARTQRQEKEKRRLDTLADSVDVVIANDFKKSKREVLWQKNLRDGRYAAALDYVLDPRNADLAPSSTVFTLLMALRHRSALRAALEGRDENSVQPVMRWVYKHMTDPRYVTVCVDVGLHLLDLYSEYVGDSAELDNGFRALRKRVKREVEKAQLACQTNGMVESLMLGGMS